MNSPECPHCVQEATAEQARIEKLEYLFRRLIRKESFRIASKSPKVYERTHYGLSFVTAISPRALELEADDGTVIAPLRINSAIAELIEIGDGIVIEAKFQNKAWRLTQFEWMAHYEFVDTDCELSDEELEQQWEDLRRANQEKNNGDCGLH